MTQEDIIELENLNSKACKAVHVCLFDKENLDVGKVAGLLTDYQQAVGYFIEKCKNAKKRHEAQQQTIEECSEFSTKQAIEIAKLKNKIVSHESTMRANGIIK